MTVKTRNIAIALPISLIGYSVYKLPKLPDHIDYETLKVVGVIVGGGIIVISGIGGMWSESNQKHGSEKGYLGFAIIIGSLSYLAARSIANKNVNSSVKIGAACGILGMGLFYLWDKSIRNPKQPTKVSSTNTNPTNEIIQKAK